MTDLAAQLSVFQHIDASATVMLPEAKTPTPTLVKMRSFGIGEGSTVCISLATGIAILSLWWLLAQKPWIVPIPGTTQMAHMLDNIGAAEITFSADELLALNTALANITLQGERLPPVVLAYSGVEAPPK